MGEWRIFIEKQPGNDFDLWTSLNLPLGSASPPVIRGDLYLVATHDVGIKFRGGDGAGPPILEVKIRSERKRRGVEEWSKVMTEVVDCNPRSFGAAELRRELEKRRLLQGKHAARLQAVITAWEQKPPMQLLLVKERRQYHFAHVLVEQTDFTVRVGGEQVGPTFRTINMEANKAKHIYALLESSGLVPRVRHQVRLLGCDSHRLCRGEHDNGFGCVTAGFPEFVCFLCDCFALRPAASGSHSALPTPPLKSA